MNVLDNTSVKNILASLAPDAAPLWGRMSPQHVVEHLASAVKISTGKREVKLYLTEQEANAIKSNIVHSDAPLTQGIKSPLLGDEPPPLVHDDMDAAVTELLHELDLFATMHRAEPSKRYIHPRMGELNLDEWLIVHNKHFAHHFRQYGLIAN
jgi:hypothetical protein